MTAPEVYLNDKPVALAADSTLFRLLKQGGLDPGQTVVTVDGRFVPMAEYKTLKLSAGARVLAREMQDGG